MFNPIGDDMALAKPAQKDTEVTETNEDVQASNPQTETSESQTEQVETPNEATETKEPTQRREVAQRASTQVAATTSSFQQQMAEQGLEGLELGFGAFPILKIVNEGQFEDEDENSYGTEFTAVVQSSRIKHLFRQSGTSEGDVSYSYDGVNLLSPTEGGATTVEGLRREFEEYGYELEMKDYLEVVVLMDDEDSEHDGEMFILSIPPASRNKFAGLIATMQLKNRSFKETPILFSVGKKRKSKRGNASYFPWSFKIAS